jgi:hypothetical protein
MKNHENTMYLNLSFQSSSHIKIAIPPSSSQKPYVLKLNADFESLAQNLSNLHISLLNEFSL